MCCLFLASGCCLLWCDIVEWGNLCLICDASSWRCSFLGRVCVSSCRCCMFVSVVHPVAILSAVFCVIFCLLKLVSDASGDHMVETYSSIGLVMALYVSGLSICIVLRAFVVVIYMCLLYMSLGSRVSPEIVG